MFVVNGQKPLKVTFPSLIFLPIKSNPQLRDPNSFTTGPQTLRVAVITCAVCVRPTVHFTLRLVNIHVIIKTSIGWCEFECVGNRCYREREETIGVICNYRN